MRRSTVRPSAVNGSGVLFTIGAGAGPDVNGNFTYPLLTYGNMAGEQIGYIVRNLNLRRALVQASSALGVAPNHNTPRRVVNVVGTPGAEQIIVDGDLANIAGGVNTVVGSILYYSRSQSSGGIQTQGDAPLGLFRLIDDGALGDPTQGIFTLDINAAQVNFTSNFRSEVVNVGGPMTEGAIHEGLSRARISANTTDEEGEAPIVPTKAVLMNTWNYTQLQLGLQAVRQVIPGVMWGSRGVHPVMGVNPTVRVTVNGLNTNTITFSRVTELIASKKSAISH